MKTLDRGFKTWAESTALGIRRELGVEPHAPLDPRALADYLGVRVWTPHDVPGNQKSVLDQLLRNDPWGWSAVSQFSDHHGVVIYNPRHSLGRQASDIMHELAHFILDHQQGTMIMSHDGSMVMRSYDRKQEDEANWLAWCLLLPRDALMHARRTGLNAAQIAERYGVSETLAVFRLQMSGVEAQLRSAGRYRRRKTNAQ